MERDYLDIQIPVKKTLTYKIRQRIGGWKTSDRSGACRFQRYRRTTGVYSPQKCFERSVRRPGVVKTLPRALLKAPLGETHPSPLAPSDIQRRTEKVGRRKTDERRRRRSEERDLTARRASDRLLAGESGSFPEDFRVKNDTGILSGLSPLSRDPLASTATRPTIIGSVPNSRGVAGKNAQRARRYYRPAEAAVSSHRHFSLVLYLLLFCPLVFLSEIRNRGSRSMILEARI